MRQLWIVVGIAAFVGVAAAEDEVQYYDSAGKRITVRGTIVEETPKAVVLERAGKKQSLPVYAIDLIRYEGQPPELVQTRSKERQGRYQEAFDDYMRIGKELPSEKPFLTAAVAFGAFRMAAELAVVDPATKAGDALKLQQSFVQAFPQSRQHYPMQEYLGRVYLARGDFTAAAAALARLAEVDWPGYKEKATVYQGVAALKQKKFADAQRLFDQVLSAGGAEGAVAEQKNLAQVYKGECLVQSGKAAEAEAVLRKALAEISPEAYEVRAIGHNALGDALRAAGKPKEAMLAGYMWVNVIYNQFPDQLARALYNLAQVFREIGQPERAQQMAGRLQAEFPNSEWTRRLATGT